MKGETLAFYAVSFLIAPFIQHISLNFEYIFVAGLELKISTN